MTTYVISLRVFCGEKIYGMFEGLNYVGDQNGERGKRANLVLSGGLESRFQFRFLTSNFVIIINQLWGFFSYTNILICLIWI